jgi:ceramide glucosyltransferase
MVHMFDDVLYEALFIAVALYLVSILYVIFAISRVIAFGRYSDYREATEQSVTVLIPICGLDDGLYDNLRSICCQAYSEYQLVLGVQDADDPAVDVIRRIIGEFPDLDIEFVGDDRIAGPNLKISNLCNMYPRAEHSIIVILDSDMRVGSRYLSTIIAPFQDAGVGAVTCLYKGTPAGGIASVLGCMFINEWFLPSVLVAHSLREISFCFGATMAVRRDVFDAIGGFDRLAPYLADDYMLGKLVTEHGYRVHLSSYVVENIVVEHGFKALFAHELRWARTIRTVQPLGYAFSFIMYVTPLAIVAGLLDEFTVDTGIFVLGYLAIAMVLRVLLHFVARRALGVSHGPSPWLVPVRDVLGFLVWSASFFGHDVTWKDQRFSVDRTGHLLAKG